MVSQERLEDVSLIYIDEVRGGMDEALKKHPQRAMHRYRLGERLKIKSLPQLREMVGGDKSALVIDAGCGMIVVGRTTRIDEEGIIMRDPTTYSKSRQIFREPETGLYNMGSIGNVVYMLKRKPLLTGGSIGHVLSFLKRGSS